MHNHTDCHHDLKHCSQCDAVYCAKCKKEWGQHAHSYFPVPYPVPVIQPRPWWYSQPVVGSPWGVSGIISGPNGTLGSVGTIAGDLPSGNTTNVFDVNSVGYC